MIALILVVLLLAALCGIFGFVIHGLLWLAFIGIIVFVVAGVFGLVRRS